MNLVDKSRIHRRCGNERGFPLQFPQEAGERGRHPVENPVLVIEKGHSPGRCRRKHRPVPEDDEPL